MKSFGKIEIRKPKVQRPSKLEFEQLSKTLIETNKNVVVSSFKASTLGENFRIFRGCFITASQMALLQSRDQFIYFCNTDGSQLNSVRLDFYPSRVALYDSNTALVSTGTDFLQTINLPELSLDKK